MRLLVSVESATEALAAIAGGADMIDAKDPRSGALGPVSVEALVEIHAAVAGRQPVTAALGDADDEAAIELSARTYAETGTAFVKVGFQRVTSRQRARALMDATARGARAGRSGTGVVAVAYADADRVGCLPPRVLSEVAADAGLEGLLIDTADKSGPGLGELVEPLTLAALVAQAHNAGLFVALAGQLTSNDLGFVRDAGADIAGVRGAACDGGRTGTVVAHRVRLLRELCSPEVTARSIP